MASSQYEGRRLSPVAIFYIVCCLLAILKIVLVSGEEILARNQPHDDLWHILAAARGYWLGSNYNNMTFVHLPVYSLWVAIVYFTGIPLRIATELFFLVSGFLFVLSLSRADVNKAVCTVAYCLIIFHPLSFQLFNITLAESLYTPLLLMALAAMIMMWINRGHKICSIYAVLSGVYSSLLWNLRKENLLILGLILLLAVIAFIVLRKEGHSWRSILQQIGIMIFVPFVVIGIVTLTLQAINYKKFGLFVSTDMSAPGYTAAYKALLRIKPPSSIRFIPVTKDVRRVAYAVSPSFKELESFLERESAMGMFETERHMGIKGEIAAGWFYWALREATAVAGHHTSAVEADAYYQRIADEINSAIDTGRLPGRLVLMTFLDPEISNYLPYLPDSYLKMWRLFTSSHQLPHEKEVVDLNPSVRKAFDIVANRRTALTSYDLATLQGWAFLGDTEPIKRVLLRSAKGVTLGVCESMLPRPDVAKAYSDKGAVKVPVNSGFSLIAAQASQQLDDAQLVFISGAQKEFTVPYKGIIAGKPIQSLTSDTKQRVTYALDSISVPSTLTFRNSMQSLIWAGYGRFVVVLSYLGMAALLVLLSCYRVINLKENIYTIMILLLFAVLSRVSLFSLLDASSWPADQPRYLFPVMPVYSCVLLLIIAQAFSVVKSRYKLKLNQ